VPNIVDCLNGMPPGPPSALCRDGAFKLFGQPQRHVLLAGRRQLLRLSGADLLRPKGAKG
jgi:hypothetical protein